MTQLEVKNLMSPDVDVWGDGLEGLEAVYFLIELEIGECGDERQDIFQVMITTPEALRARASELSPVLCSRATLVFSEPSWKQVVREINNIVLACNAPTWEEAVVKLQRFFLWEYEDYVQSD